jgi:endonuclease YncB( thermonuclease family)
MANKIYTWDVLSVISVHDGDTAHFSMRGREAADLGFGMKARGETEEFDCRCAGYASLELAMPGGKEAQAFHAQLIGDGKGYWVESLKWDKYAPRFDGKIYRPDGVWLGQLMIDAGYALPWDGKGSQPKPVWPIPPKG